jgi:hypothetical protein
MGFVVSLLGLGVREDAPFFLCPTHSAQVFAALRPFFASRRAIQCRSVPVDLYQIVVPVQRYASAVDDDASFVIGKFGCTKGLFN